MTGDETEAFGGTKDAKKRGRPLNKREFAEVFHPPSFEPGTAKRFANIKAAPSQLAQPDVYSVLINFLLFVFLIVQNYK